MAERQGTPVWYELLTEDPDAAQDFYGRIMDWTFEQPSGGLERDYRMFTSSDGEGVGAVMGMPDGTPFPPTWMVYFAVEDVDATTERVKSLGGGVRLEPADIPGVGRFSFVTDPQGASFYLMRGDGERESTAFEPTKAGRCSWNELVTSDQGAALEFYSTLYGWEKSGAMAMPEAGDYTFIQQGDAAIGAMMDARGDEATSFWNFAFTVTDIDVAKAAIEAGGGTVRVGPMELPDGSGWLVQAVDPHGAKVMFTGGRRR